MIFDGVGFLTQVDRSNGLGYALGMAPPAEQIDPVLLSLMNAPISDEPETEEERISVEAAKAEIRAGGRLYTHEEVEQYWLGNSNL